MYPRSKVRLLLIGLWFLLVSCNAKNQPLTKKTESTSVPEIQSIDKEDPLCGGRSTSFDAVFSHSPENVVLVAGSASVNVSVRTTGGCNGDFELTGSPLSEPLRFSKDTTFSATLNREGIQILRFVLEAFDGKRRSLGRKNYDLFISVSPSPTPTPTQSPSPSPSPTPTSSPVPVACSILSLNPVSNTNAPWLIQVEGTGPIVDATLNGQHVDLGVPVNLLPSGGQYAALAEVFGINGQRATCSVFLDAPRVGITVKGVTALSVTFELTFAGDVDELNLNGKPVNLPVLGNVLEVSETPTGPGCYSAQAEVLSIEGHRGTASASYRVPHRPLQFVAGDQGPNFLPSLGFRLPTPGSAAISGFGNQSNYWFTKNTTFDVFFVDSTVSLHTGHCPSDHVVVGLAPYSPPNPIQVVCSPLQRDGAGYLSLFGEVAVSFGWDFNRSGSCLANQIMVGLIWDPNDKSLLGQFGKMTLLCATPFWVENSCP